jgi:hypothetical protein
MKASLPPLDREVDVMRQVIAMVEERLPVGWLVEPKRRSAANPGRSVDALIELVSPQGDDVTLVVEVKKSVVTRDLPNVVEQLRNYASRADEEPPIPLLIARYLSSSAQTWLTDRDVPYADATGNIRISLDRPALFLRDVGASKDPWRGPGRPRGTLIGEPPARVVRALVDFEPPFSVPQLVALSGASTGATYRVVDFLEEQALIERAPRGPIEMVRWQKVLERWGKDYGFMRTNSVRRYLQPRGLTALMGGLAAVRDIRYAVTGSVAAQKWAPYAPPRLATIYADDPDRLAIELDLREIDTGANVLIATSTFDVVFERTQSYEGVTIVAPSQAAVDLMTGPGRNPAEAQAVIEWMEKNVKEWRR